MSAIEISGVVMGAMAVMAVAGITLLIMWVSNVEEGEEQEWDDRVITMLIVAWGLTIVASLVLAIVTTVTFPGDVSWIASQWALTGVAFVWFVGMRAAGF